MRFLRCVHAEFLLVVPRLTRTRLGMTLLVLGTTLVWLSARGFDALTVTLREQRVSTPFSGLDTTLRGRRRPTPVPIRA